MKMATDDQTVILGMNKYERQRLLNDQVRARNDFSATDAEYYANNGRLFRLRPPLPTEYPRVVASLQALGRTPFVIIYRSGIGEQSRPIALIAVHGELAETLPVELGMMGDVATRDLTMKKDIKWWPL
jgi:hypothetical protein